MKKKVCVTLSLFLIMMITACSKTEVIQPEEVISTITNEENAPVYEEIASEEEATLFDQEDSVESDVSDKSGKKTKSDESNKEEANTSDEDSHKTSESNKGFIIIGDSHIVVTEGHGYNKYGSSVEGVNVGENLFFVHTSMDPVMGTFDWLSGDGTNRIREIMDAHNDIDDWAIISMHGTSMCVADGIEDSYIDLYKKWMKKTFKDAKVYLVSVPPLDEAKWVENHPELPARFNKDIEDFNKALKKQFSKNFYDYYDWMKNNGTFLDEIHYTGETYLNMFDQVITDIVKR